jgi:hypothetical protein
MLSKNKIIFTSVILISLLNLKCDDDSINNCDFAICTEEFRSIVLIIKYNADHSPYLLSDYKIIRISDNKDITPISDSFSTSHGYYPITNDMKKELFKFKNVKVEFKGYLNNDLVIQRQFTITADCCHISLVEGNTLILI